MSSSAHFCHTGRILGFSAGDNSPRQMMLMQVLEMTPHKAVKPLGTLNPSETPPNVAASYTLEISLGSSVQRMMYGYLAVGDWIKLVGKRKLDSVTGDSRWKAKEIVKLLPSQAQYFSQNCPAPEVTPVAGPLRTQQTTKESTGKESTGAEAKVNRVLICQKSGCRQRGAQAVQRVMEQAIVAAGQGQTVAIQATGCMKQCNLGPTVVMLPKGHRHHQVTPSAARQILQSIL
ncbi:MAG: (2Fe-2S) ferredoxin domain-containing protein [Cyanobacteria bacterium J06634_5]